MNKQSRVKSSRKALNPVFHLQTKKEDDGALSQGMIKAARKNGQLNLSGRGLACVPDRLFSMYETEIVSCDLSNTPDEAWWSFSPLTLLDLSSNALHGIPKEIKTFEDLSVLNLQDNCLVTVPAEIGSLAKLTKLNLNHNKLAILPEQFYKLAELQELQLSHNCLEQLSEELANLVMLRQLDLSHNGLTSLPAGVGFLTRLAQLNLAHNRLAELPPDVVGLRGLTRLDLTHNDLKELPSLSDLRKLALLYAQHNDIRQLPTVDGCEKLAELYFGNNYITDVPVEFCESLPHLKILDLRDNRIEALPDEIAMLQQVVRLDVTNNELTSLPNTLSYLPHLQNLQVEGNKLKQIRSDVIKGGTIRILKHLREKLDGEALPPSTVCGEGPSETHNFPDWLSLKHSKALSLPMRDLATVSPEVFEQAKKAEVTTVDLCKNKLGAVPDGLNQLAPFLTELNLSSNRIARLPDWASDFAKLQYLDLGRNTLTDLPASLGGLACLRELVLANNRFGKVPECVYDLERLEILLAADNAIAEIRVEGLSRLRRLATLDLSNNSIARVPLELGHMKQLRCLKLTGNSFRQPRYAVLEQGTESVLAYLRDRIPQ